MLDGVEVFLRILICDKSNRDTIGIRQEGAEDAFLFAIAIAFARIDSSTTIWGHGTKGSNRNSEGILWRNARIQLLARHVASLPLQRGRRAPTRNNTTYL